MKKWLKRITVLSLGVALSAGITVQAGNINIEEERVIAAASGIFEYNGKTYVADGQYVEKLEEKLSEDGVDLSETQASGLISQIGDRIGEGVDKGYLVQTEGSKDTETIGTEGDTKDTETTKNEDTDGKGKAKSSASSNGKDKTDSDTGQQLNQLEEISDDSGNSGRETNLEIDIAAIEKKKPEDRTKEEAAAYDQYIAKKAVEELDINGTAQNGGKVNAAKADPKPLKFYGMVVGIVVIGSLLLILGIFRLRKVQAGKIKAAVIVEKGLTDIHSHILPEVDDGSSSMEMTLEMLQRSYNQGVRKMIATPHYRIGHNRKSQEEIRRQFQEVKLEATKLFPDLKLYLGNEVFYSDGIIERLKEGRAMTLAGSNHVLVEFRTDEAYQRILGAVIDLLRNRYIPIIAHVERYEHVINSVSRMKELGNSGAILQINSSAIGKYRKCLKKGLLHVAASDCHDMNQRAPDIGMAVKVVCTECAEDISSRILNQCGNEIIENGKR